MAAHAILTAEDHGTLRIRTDRGAELGDAMMAALVMPGEFRAAQAEYPILFRLDQDRQDFTALAMFGFENGENLFLQGGSWDAAYRPLSIDVQPFLIGRSEDPDAPGQVHLDMDSPRIETGTGTSSGGESVRVFDEHGRPTPYLEAVAEKLGALDEFYRAAPGFFAALRRHDLLEPFTLQVRLEDGSTNRLVGFHVIDEDKLRRLDGAALGALHEEGHLLPIFMALASLSNLSALIARKNRALTCG